MDIEITSEPARHLAARRFDLDLDHVGEQMGEAFGAVARFLDRENILPTGPAMAYYEVGEEGMRVSAGFLVDPPIREGDGVVDREVPEREVVRGVHVGSYDTLPKTYDALRATAEARGRKLDETAMWEEYLTGPDHPPEEMRTRVSWPLAD
ncbi:GyrI-like domain-containing protein [Nocardioides coralli]|uniref:GyrI-like domain-containing protein n=1 Tax=Nocardioides coralli TaxID=2872154 RepID=UPI001CA4446C|nr:GyrI-like domain-containing protein [Nocardioides coralli]QZY28642.1 GyrI-like domain-containing protein [Nocardioides coralli]